MSAQIIIDYAAMLADLEAKKAVIDSAIASVRAAMAAGALGVSVGDAAKVAESVSLSVSSQPFDGDIPSGLFKGKSIPEATKLYLSMVNRKQTTKDLARALEEGGLHTTSDNFAGTVDAGLFRASRKTGEIVRVKGQWALAEWYKGMRVGPQEKKPPTKKKAKRKPKADAKKAAKQEARKMPTPPEPEQPTEQPNKKGAQVLIEEFFGAHVGHPLSPGEIATGLGLRVQTVGLICAKLAYRGEIEKTADGKFLKPKAQRVA